MKTIKLKHNVGDKVWTVDDRQIPHKKLKYKKCKECGTIKCTTHNTREYYAKQETITKVFITVHNKRVDIEYQSPHSDFYEGEKGFFLSKIEAQKLADKRNKVMSKDKA